MAAKLTHGVVDACTCRALKWKGEGHHDDCPARQPEPPHPCTCSALKWKGEGHHESCPSFALTRGV